MKKLTYHNIFDCILLAIGVFGLLGGFYNALVFPAYSNSIIIFWVCISILLYFKEVLKKKWKYLTGWIISAIIVIILCFLLDFTTLIGGINEVISNDYFLNFTELFTNYNTPLVLVITIYMIFGFLITKILVHYLCYQKHQKILLIACILWMIFPYFIDHPIATIYFYFSIFFIISSYTYKTSLQFLEIRGMITQLLISVVLISSLSLFEFTVANNASFQKNVIEIFPGLEYLKLGRGSNNSQLGASRKPETNLPTNNITMNTDEALTVISDTPFSGYLRGFSLSSYKNNGWDTPKKGTQYPSLNYYFDAVSKGDAFQVEIKTKQKYTYQFIPYYSNVGRRMSLDSFVDYFETSYAVILENSKIDKIVSVDEQYLNYVSDNYMSVDSNTLDMLKQYMVSHNIDIEALRQESVTKKIEVIRELLANNTKYSLNAGVLPEGVDFIDNFLNISKYGSCTHYTTSAALMLRIVDVSTRFTSGFVVSKSDFKDGKAIIRNNRSHAWVEVFDLQYGWYPVEFTPGREDGINAEPETPGSISNMLDNQIPEANRPTPPTTDTPTTGGNTTSTTTKEEVDTSISPYLLVVTGVVAVISLIGIQRRVRYRLKKKRYFNLTNNQKVCKGYQYLKKYQVSLLPIEELSLKAKFSQYTITTEELQFFEDYVTKQLNTFYKQMPIYKKIYYTYIQAKR